jgi:cytochrome c
MWVAVIDSGERLFAVQPSPSKPFRTGVQMTTNSALRPRVGAVILFAALGVSACGADEERPADVTSGASTSSATPATAGDLTQFQLENGIGPLTTAARIDAKVDEELAERGEKLFEQKCASCHKLSERYVGPPLVDVIKRRTPTFMMNMMLNPLEMVQRHPETKKLLAEFFVAMPNQNLTSEEARQVFEYLRSEIH